VGEMLRKSIDGNRYKAGASLGRLKGCVLYGDFDGDGWIERRMALGSRHPNFSFGAMAAITFEPHRLRMGERSLWWWGRLYSQEWWTLRDTGKQRSQEE
jgi:hypothetical protein